MAIEFNHTLVHTSNKKVSASFVAEILGLPEPKPFGIFLVLKSNSLENNS